MLKNLNELKIFFYGEDNFTLSPDGEGYILSGDGMIDNNGVLVEIIGSKYCNRYRHSLCKL